MQDFLLKSMPAITLKTMWNELKKASYTRAVCPNFGHPALIRHSRCTHLTDAVGMLRKYKSPFVS